MTKKINFRRTSVALMAIKDAIESDVYLNEFHSVKAVTDACENLVRIGQPGGKLRNTFFLYKSIITYFITLVGRYEKNVNILRGSISSVFFFRLV